MIASSIPGFSSVITDGVDGVLVPPRHPKEWGSRGSVRSSMTLTARRR